MKILLSMIFLAIADDFYLQPIILAKLKQAKFYKGASIIYKYDYVASLFIHAFSWTFMMMLPLFYNLKKQEEIVFIALFWINVFVHAFADNAKCNAKMISLKTDQLIHIIQIILTFIIFKVLV